MRTNLPKSIQINECGIINLDDFNGPGTHWVAYVKRSNIITYFDSYGNLPPPLEVERYFNPSKNVIRYNHQRYQADSSSNCGQLCLIFLTNNI